MVPPCTIRLPSSSAEIPFVKPKEPTPTPVVSEPLVIFNNPDRRILLSGLLKMTSGSLTTGVGVGSLGFTKGISAEDDGSLIVQGGTITTSQLRTRVSGVNNFAYNQSGGTVNVGSISGVDSGFARFDLQFTTCTFIMTGGILNVSNPTNNSPSGFRVGSASSSYSVTG